MARRRTMFDRSTFAHAHAAAGPVKSRRSRTLAIAAVLAAVGACSTDGGSVTDPGQVDLGQGDHSANGNITIDETKLTGSLEAGSLTVHIPVTGMGVRDVSGTLNVRLTDVRGTQPSAATQAAYAVHGTEKVVVDVQLPAPAGITQQADLVHFNLRID